jgi:hypothetical protein
VVCWAGPIGLAQTWPSRVGLVGSGEPNPDPAPQSLDDLLLSRPSRSCPGDHGSAAPPLTPARLWSSPMPAWWICGPPRRALPFYPIRFDFPHSFLWIPTPGTLGPPPVYPAVADRFRLHSLANRTSSWSASSPSSALPYPAALVPHVVVSWWCVAVLMYWWSGVVLVVTTASTTPAGWRLRPQPRRPCTGDGATGVVTSPPVGRCRRRNHGASTAATTPLILLLLQCELTLTHLCLWLCIGGLCEYGIALIC